MARAVVCYKYRWHQLVANQILTLLKQLRLPIFSLEAESILAAAQKQTGMNDYGDERCLDALNQLLNIAKNIPLTSLGQVMTRTTCVKAMVNRMWLEHWSKTEPHRFGKLEKPIFIVGLPRSGTTVLQNLINCDPNRRAVPFWEILTPCPIDSNPMKDEKIRMQMGRQIVRGAYYMAPEQRFIHQISVSSPEECWLMLFNSFAVLNFELAQGFDGWSKWLLNHSNMLNCYREYRRFLEICQGRLPKQQLVLKCPEHLWFLRELTQVFPDAELVWTHRRIDSILPSYASLISLIQRSLFGRIDPVNVGRRLLPLLSEGLRRGLEARAEQNLNVCDIGFDLICKDPVRAVHEIYEYFGRDVSNEHEVAMLKWLRNKKQDVQGAHTYEAQTWGFKENQHDQFFQQYHHRFADHIK